ncbi:MAG: IS66 family transposase zinc-finger binding domain-containing protein [Verrucomicrobia bacterium]|nr:IS66 family transposase zinc-finger binding domain-containing protein [Verrucomicrobiota bacterium]
MRLEPDHVIEHGFGGCCGNCGGSLKGTAATGIERRQVFDLPPLKLVVTEHRVACGKCPRCLVPVKGSFPAGVQAPVQYGNGVQALVSYLGAFQMIPCERIAELFADLRSVISTARKAGSSILDTLKQMFDSPDQAAVELVPCTAGT